MRRFVAAFVRRIACGVLLGASGIPLTACGGGGPEGVVLTFPGSTVGAEGELLRRQLERFMAERPGITVIQRPTPDAADQRHQLYVQWLSAGARP